MLLVVCWGEPGLSLEQPSRMYGIAPFIFVYGWTHFLKTVCICVGPAKNSIPPHVRYPRWDACWQGGGDDCSTAAGAMPGICFTKASWRFWGPACWVMSYGWGFWATQHGAHHPLDIRKRKLHKVIFLFVCSAGRPCRHQIMPWPFGPRGGGDGGVSRPLFRSRQVFLQSRHSHKITWLCVRILLSHGGRVRDEIAIRTVASVRSRLSNLRYSMIIGSWIKVAYRYFDDFVERYHISVGYCTWKLHVQ